MMPTSQKRYTTEKCGSEWEAGGGGVWWVCLSRGGKEGREANESTKEFAAGGGRTVRQSPGAVFFFPIVLRCGVRWAQNSGRRRWGEGEF